MKGIDYSTVIQGRSRVGVEYSRGHGIEKRGFCFRFFYGNIKELSFSVCCIGWGVRRERTWGDHFSWDESSFEGSDG